MAELPFDPGLGDSFWDSVQSLPGYPRNDRVRLRQMVFESDAVRRLPAVLAEAGAQSTSPLLVIMDETRMTRGGDDLKPLILSILTSAGWHAQAVVARADATGQVHADFEQIGRVQARLSPGCAVLSTGSGTITDIAKHACHRFEQESGGAVPFIVYQTANSVSAFTSNMAPTFVEGVKRTLPSRYPDALVCDLETLRDAPYAMTAAGVGDLLAAGVSFADWRLAHGLGLDDSYSPLAERLLGRLSRTLLDLAGAVRARDLDAMADLAKLIALAGLAMSLSHATTPLSGSEHVFSHVLDMMAEADARPLGMHGAQVALAAVRMASSYAVFLGEYDPADPRRGLRFPGEDESRAAVSRAFEAIDPSGRVADECWRDYAVKLEAWRGREKELSSWPHRWPQARNEIAGRTWSASTMLRVMRDVGLPQTFGELEPAVPEAQARAAYLSAHWIRKRFTLGDMLYFSGWDRQALWERVSHAGGGRS